jgi:hypothetical protein
MAAGCPALLKPSEVGPVVSALFADFFPKYLDTSAYRVTNGGVPEITYILKLKWESQCVRRSEDLALHIMCRFAYSSFVCVLAHSTPVPSAASATAPTPRLWQQQQHRRRRRHQQSHYQWITNNSNNATNNATNIVKTARTISADTVY